MKTKLWIIWFVIGLLALLFMFQGEKTTAYALAFIAAGFGFTAFLLE